MKNKIIILKYDDRDFENLKEVYYEVGNMSGKMPESVLDAMEKAFLMYYLCEEKEHCFVAEADGNAIGYILCAPDVIKWECTFKEKYVMPDSEIDHMLFRGVRELPVKYGKEYPAHLHIDILPEYQHMGIGTRLMDALLSHLSSRGVKGVMLCVSQDNRKGIAFYKNYGFKILEETEHEIAMGIYSKDSGGCQ